LAESSKNSPCSISGKNYATSQFLLIEFVNCFSKTEKWIVPSKREEIILHVKDNTGIIVYKEPLLSVNTNQQHILSETGSLVEAAKNLYQILHHVDKLNYETIICEMLPQEELGNTINERLKRAASIQNDNA